MINTENFDAVVIGSNGLLLPSGKARCGILRKAGSKVQVECNRIMRKITKIPVGKAVMTTSGNFPSQYIIHVVGPRLGQGHEGKKLMLATWNCLKLADEAGLNSILLPPISKEMLGFNAKICSDVMLPTIKKYLLEKNQNLSSVSICLEDLPDYKNFERVLNNLEK